MDRAMTSRLDAWITRDPPEPEEREPLHCSACGQFLPEQPGRKIEEQSFSRCSGRASVYEEEHGEGVLAIIGDEFRGKTFQRAFPPPCGTKDGKGDMADAASAEEINPHETEEWEHEPHWFPEPYGFATRYVRVCKGCGTSSFRAEV